MKNKVKLGLFLSVIAVILFISFLSLLFISPLCDANHFWLFPWFALEEPIDQKLVEQLEKQVFTESREVVKCKFIIDRKEGKKELVTLPEGKTEYLDMKKYSAAGNCTENKTLNYELILIKDMVYRVDRSLGRCKEPFYHITERLRKGEIWIELGYYHKLGEEVKVKVHNDLDINTIYTDFWDSNWKIYQYLDNEWKLVSTGSKYPLCFCYEDICNTLCPSFAPLMPRCKKLDPGKVMYWTWNQKILQQETVKCNNITVSCYRWINATAGTYKVEFCYSFKKEGDLEGFCELANEIECVEKEFEITD